MTAKTTEERILNTYQCDRYGIVRPVMLMNELQAVADISAESLDCGRTFCVQNNVGWVVTHYLVDIVESPHEGEKLFISTWPVGNNGVRAIRDFEVRGCDNRLLVRATSQWVLIDLNTRRPLRLDDSLPCYAQLNVRAWDRPFNRAPEFDADKTHIFKCRYDDVDVNQHINNAVYAAWATESVGFEYRNTHKLSGMEIYFEHEIPADTSAVQIDVALSPHKTQHRIRVDSEAKAHIVCYWS